LNKAKKAFIAMSGGVDSSVAAALMIEKGFDCSGLTLALYGKSGTAGKDAAAAAAKLGIPHHVLNLTETFQDRVIKTFIETYEKGATPNPCVACNRYVKFAFPLFNNDFDVYATGHYAQVEKSGSRRLLKKAVDLNKDQSYVLFSLDQKTLASTCFPLGVLTKSEVRKLAEERNLDNAHKKESQDICFVPDGDYAAFIEGFTGKHYPHGDILDLDGNIIGAHKGLIRYTIGQRRGLGAALNKPVYVCAKDPIANTVTLGPESALLSKVLVINDINLIACESIEKPLKVKVKTRYLQTEHPATAIQTGPDEIRIEFDEEQRAITPGQAAVMYDGDIVVGGGLIQETDKLF
jgi:tRNA-specific 2-thiouridylase